MTVGVSIDGEEPVVSQGETVRSIGLASGRHEVDLTISGQRAVEWLDLSQDELVEVRGHKWCCVFLFDRGGAFFLQKLSASDCKRITSVGPD